MREKRSFAERTRVLPNDEVKKNTFWYMRVKIQKPFILKRLTY